MCFSTRSDEEEPLITLELLDESGQHSLRALLDSGASSNFLRKATLDETYIKFIEREIPPTKVKVRLATGKIVSTRKRVVRLAYTLEGLQLDDDFIVLDLDNKFDVILGMPWLKRHQALVDFTQGTVKLKEERSDDEISEREDACELHALTEGACDAKPLRITPDARKQTERDDPSDPVAASNGNARVTSKSSMSSRCEGTHNAISTQLEGAQPQAVSRPQHRECIARVARRNGTTIEENSRLSSQGVRSPAAVPGRPSTSKSEGSEGDMAATNPLHHSSVKTAVRKDERAEENEELTVGTRPSSTSSSETEVVPLAGRSQQDSGRDRVVDASEECIDRVDAGGHNTCEIPSSMDSKKASSIAWTSKQSRNVELNAGFDENIQVETLNVLVNDGERVGASTLSLESPPSTADELIKLEGLDQKHFLRELRKNKITQVCMIVAQEERSDLRSALTSPDVEVRSSSTMDESVLAEHEKTKIERFETQSWKALERNPLYDVLREFKDVFPEEIPDELPKDRGIRHEIELQPGTKYCVTRQWPLPRDQVKAIDDFFEARRRAGHVRESMSPHSSPTFCVKKSTGGWRIVHAFNKLNAATVPAQTPIPRKDVIIDGMQGSTIFSALDLRDGYYQILMREQDIPLTAVSTPSGMLWEWLVMPQGLSNAPATFNRCVTHLLRSVREFAPSYFDDVFVHSKAMNGKTDVEMHRIHVRKLLELMRKHKLYANLKKCVFAAPEIPVLGCFVSKNGVRPDPEKIRTIKEWPPPANVKQLRQFLGMATYLHKYSRGFAQRALPLSALLRKDAAWKWTALEQQSFASIKQSLIEAPVLAIADQNKEFFVVCDASDNAIGCALMQKDDDGNERVISYESRQLKAAERNYPVHDKELLAMKYALAKYRIYLMGDRSFTVYTDHASLRTAINSPHLSQRMARWLSFFAEFNFKVEYKPGRFNVVADALSRRPNSESTRMEDDHTEDARGASVVYSPSSPLLDDVRKEYARDKEIAALFKYLSEPNDRTAKALSSVQRARLHRYKIKDGLLWYRALVDDDFAIVVPNNEDLRLRILFEYHDAPASGHRGREKTYVSLRRDFYWPRQYKFVRKYVQACEVCQRTKASVGSQAPLQSLPVPADCWRSISMDFVFGLPKDKQGRDGVLVFVDRFSKMVHLAAVSETITAAESARVFMENVFRLHGMPDEVVSDRDPRFVASFWQSVFRDLGTRLKMSTSDHPQTDGQTERANRVLEEILRAYAHSFESWSAHLPMAEFAINNSVHASTGHSPFYVNGLRHPRLPSLLGLTQRASAVDKSTAEDQSMPSDGLEVRIQDDEDSSQHVRSDVGSERNDLMDLSAVTTRSQSKALESMNPIDTTRDASVTTRRSLTPDDSNVVAPEENATSPRRPTARHIAASVHDFTHEREAVVRFIQDAIADASDRQKANADAKGRNNAFAFEVGDSVLLSTHNLPTYAVSAEETRKLVPKYIGPFRVVRRNGSAYTLNLPSALKTHPTFYVGRLRPYRSGYGRASDDVVPPSSSPIDDATCSPIPLTQRSLRIDSSIRDVAYPATSSTPPVGVQTLSPTASAQVAPGAASSPAPRSPPIASADKPVYPPPPPPLKDASGQQQWLVDSLVDHRDQPATRLHPTRRQYRVRWLGYPPSHDTWEDRAALIEDLPDDVRAYDREHPLV